MLLTFSATVMAGQAALIERLSAAVAELDLRPTLTLGPAIGRDTVHVPDAVEVLPFGDHDRLLPECALVVTHGGLGTVLRALAHGVPLLVVPLGRDQAFNGGRVEALGAGIALPLDAEPQRIQAALASLRSDASYRAAAEQAGRRIAAGRPDRSCRRGSRIAHALRPSGRNAPSSRPADPRRYVHVGCFKKIRRLGLLIVTLAAVCPAAESGEPADPHLAADYRGAPARSAACGCRRVCAATTSSSRPPSMASSRASGRA